MRFHGSWHFAVAAAGALLLSASPVRSADATAAPAPTPAMAAVGSTAPPVVGSSTFGGKIEQFDLSKAVTHGAVVLYFFPKAFTSG